MSTVKEIESAITALPPKEIAELHSWFRDFAAPFLHQGSHLLCVERLRSQYANARVRADAERVNDLFPSSEEA